MILKIIALIIILIGVIFVYDARILSSKWFGFGDLNQATNRNKNWRILLSDNWRNYNIVSIN